MLHRCVPKPVKELASQVIGGLYGLINSWDTIEQVISDLYETWDTILALCFLALGKCLIMTDTCPLAYFDSFTYCLVLIPWRTYCFYSSFVYIIEASCL